MAPTAPIVLALFRQATSSSPDEQSMLQMQMQMPIQNSDGSECRCPGYFKQDCLDNAFQGCLWHPENNWCTCDPNFVPPTPLFTHPDRYPEEGPAPAPGPAPVTTEAPAPAPEPAPAPGPAPVTTEAPAPAPEPAPAPAPATDFLSPQGHMPCSAGEAAATTQSMSTADYKQIVIRMNDILTVINDAVDGNCDHDTCPQADWAGCVLRMAGHDFMDFMNGEGGSDGCIDFGDPDNAGLDPCLFNGEFGHSINDVYQEWCTQISLADFLVISGEAVMTILRNRDTETPEMTADAATPDMNLMGNFRFGRTTKSGGDCEALYINPDAPRRLPNPEDGCPATEQTFMAQLGLTADASAALMGVHSIGRARTENSGYEGFWSDPENARKFNNNYFVSMFVKGWGAKQMSANKHQWNRIDRGTLVGDGHREMMLNTDLCLLYTEDGAGINAADEVADGCCAWVDSFMLGGEASGEHTGIIANHGGEFCGTDCANDPFGELSGCNGSGERNMCCGSPDGVNTGFLNADGSTSFNDCGSPPSPNGMASAAIRRFAEDEAAFINEFQAAWTLVTEKGAGALRTLATA